MNVSIKDIYTYVASLLIGVNKNIYRTEIPETINDDASKNGFIVLRLGSIRDNSEFLMETYGSVRMQVEYYIPSVNITKDGLTTNGVMNTTKFDEAQTKIDNIINAECKKTNQKYTISRDGVISSNDFYPSKAKSYFVYITSFLITI